MSRLLILADDLTGALDAGVQLGKNNMEVMVLTRTMKDLGSEIKKARHKVIVINTESRHMDKEKAARRVKKIIRIAEKYPGMIYYKKIDSTLRGNIGAELEAYVHATGQTILPFVPANPRLKRFTRKGFHYIGDMLLHHTSFARDPLEAVTTSYIPEIIGHQSRIRVIPVSTSDFTGTNSAHVNAPAILLFDCSSTTTLKKIAQHIRHTTHPKAMAGSAGMIDLLPQLYDLKKKPNKKSPVACRRPVLMVNGSLNDLSIRQMYQAAGSGHKVFIIPRSFLHGTGHLGYGTLRKILQEIRREVDSGNDILINSFRLAGDPDEFRHNSLRQKLPAGKKLHIANQIGRFINRVLKENNLNTLAVSGGDTLSGIIRSLKCEKIHPDRELLPGVALAHFTVNGKDKILLSKPGGYGKIDVVNEMLKKSKRI